VRSGKCQLKVYFHENTHVNVQIVLKRQPLEPEIAVYFHESFMNFRESTTWETPSEGRQRADSFAVGPFFSNKSRLIMILVFF